MRAVVALVCVLLASCKGEAPGDGDILVTGRLVDDETGRPVPRTTIYVHAFSDAVRKQVSLDPGEGSEFSLRLPTRNVRLRVADIGDEYALWERTFTVDGDILEQEVRLKPLHWIRLHGRILVDDGTGPRPLPRGDGGIGSRAMVSFSPGGRMHEDLSDSSYWVRVPRQRVRVSCLNSAEMPTEREIDLTGATEVEREYDVILR